MLWRVGKRPMPSVTFFRYGNSTNYSGSSLMFSVSLRGYSARFIPKTLTQRVTRTCETEDLKPLKETFQVNGY